VATLRAEVIDAAAVRNGYLSRGDWGDSEVLDSRLGGMAATKEQLGVAEMAPGRGGGSERGAAREDVPTCAEFILRFFATALSANAGSGCCSAIALQSIPARISGCS